MTFEWSRYSGSHQGEWRDSEWERHKKVCVVGSGEREIVPSPTLKLDLSHRWPSCAVCLKNENHNLLAKSALMKE